MKQDFDTKVLVEQAYLVVDPIYFHLLPVCSSLSDQVVDKTMTTFGEEDFQVDSNY